MKVCFVSHSCQLGGAETALLETIEVLKEAGVTCYVLVLGHGPLNEELDRIGVANIELPFGRWMGVGTDSILQQFVMFLKTMAVLLPAVIQVKRWGCQMVYTNTVTIYFGALIAWVLRLPHIWCFQEFGFEDHRLKFFCGDKMAWSLINRLSSACIACSHAVEKKYRNHLSRPPLTTFYYSMHRFKPTTDVAHIFNPDAIFRCVIIGALNEGKGQDQAIKAVAILVCRGLNVELRILGKGGKTYTESLLALIKEHHLEDRVKLEGHVKNPASFINRADVLLMCSRSEAFGRVTIEGMLSGKPVIGSDTGATAEFIRDEFNGFLYRQGSPADLADKITLLAKDKVKAQSMGENGKNWATQTFSKELHTADVLKVLNRLLPAKLGQSQQSNAKRQELS